MTAFRSTLAVVSLLLMGMSVVFANERPLLIVSTTSVEHSGLMADLLPKFEATTGVRAVVAAFGTGQALRVARSGDADVLIVHDEASEKAFIEDGYGVERRPFMMNEYLVVGPVADPALTRGSDHGADAFQKIRDAGAAFVSRGDNSGTHEAERRIWQRAGLDPDVFEGRWYRSAGSGMGPTLNTAAAMEAYTLTDQGTWLAFRNRDALRVMVSGDPTLANPYSVILIDPDRHPHLQHDKARALADWLVSRAGQAAIAAFRIGGEQAFRPIADGLD